MPILSAIRILIAAGLSVLSCVMLVAMFMAETQSNYVNWAISGGCLIMAVAFALIVYDGEDEVQTTLK